MIQVPIFHVNGEDPEAAVYVAELALEFRQTFHCDVVIDMFCYRRHGHNEGDEPSFTQPVMYDKIRKRPTLTRSLHRTTHHERRPDRRRDRGRCTRSSRTKLQTVAGGGRARRRSIRRHARLRAATGQGLTPHYSHGPVETGVADETLRDLPRGWRRVPEGFTVHPKIARAARSFGSKELPGRQAGRLGVRRGAGVRLAAPGRYAGAPERSGQPARHVQPAPCGPVRHRHR